MSDDRQRDAMRAQLVDAFMNDDMPRYREACAWLRSYIVEIKRRKGRVLVNENWFDPAKMEQWRRALAIANLKRNTAKRRAAL